MKNEKLIYNGIPSEAADFFIEQIEGRLEKRPWTPSEEVSVMRAFNCTLRKFFDYKEITIKNVKKIIAKQEIEELFSSTKGNLYYSDIMEKLGLDLELVVEICKELMKEGKIKDIPLQKIKRRKKWKDI